MSKRSLPSGSPPPCPDCGGKQKWTGGIGMNDGEDLATCPHCVLDRALLHAKTTVKYGKCDSWMSTAMGIEAGDEARKFLNRYIKAIRKDYKISTADARTMALGNIGYWAGYYGLNIRQRMETAFGAVHPYFGSSFGPQPSPEEILAMGMAMGEGLKDGSIDLKSLTPEGLRAAVLREKTVEVILSEGDV